MTTDKLFFKNKQIQLLLACQKTRLKNHRGKGKTGYTLARQVDCQYSYTVKILQRFEEQGLITRERHGRKKHVTLTDKGRVLAEKLGSILETVET